MPRINWQSGGPPDTHKTQRLLLVATPLGRPFDAAADNLPSIYVGHYSQSMDAFVPARLLGMSENEPHPALRVHFWAEIDLPAGVEAGELSNSDFFG